ncbi:DUF805 domain-containing protein [Oleispirillum naphthae]|uniref:DUF805 domain-containing protein n=1 Tax=Oleispirillum naphthae TaxID=2838853 RepID=UPI0030825E4A
MMTFSDAIRVCFAKYAAFAGRAARAEFWWWVGFYLLGSAVVVIFDAATFPLSGGLFSLLFPLAIFLPTLAVAARRLHDIGKSGWWLLLWLVPLIGPLILIYWWASRGEAGPNDHGPDPLNPDFVPDAPFVEG